MQDFVLGSPDASLGDLAKILARDPYDQEARFERAETLIRNHRWTEAQSELTSYCRLFPTDGVGWLRLAEVLHRISPHDEEVQAALAQALAHLPDGTDRERALALAGD